MYDGLFVYRLETATYDSHHVVKLFQGVPTTCHLVI